jgi:hypothetical protein
LILGAGALGIAGGSHHGQLPPRTHDELPPPTKRITVGDTSPNGLTGMGIALVVAPQLLIVGFVVPGNVQ